MSYQLASEPSRVTKESKTLNDYIYTNAEENIQRINVERLCFSDPYAVFCNRKSQLSVGNNMHKIIEGVSARTWLTPFFVKSALMLY